jgi:hypothetical protein
MVSAFEDLVPPNSCQLTLEPEGSNQPSTRFSGQFLGVGYDDVMLVDGLVTVQFPTVVERDQSGDLGVASSNECYGSYLDFGATRRLSHQRCSSTNDSFRCPAPGRTDHSSVI